MAKLFQKSKSKKCTFLTAIYKKNEEDKNKFLLVVSKKTGNAVYRNKIKRMLRRIIKESNIKKVGYNIGLIARKEILLTNEKKIKEFIESI